MFNGKQVPQKKLKSIALELTCGKEAIVKQGGHFYTIHRVEEVAILNRYDNKDDIFASVHLIKKLIDLIVKAFGNLNEQVISKNFVSLTIVI
jgi:hypothetical protein